jgi:hypothetical protein
MKVFNLTDVPTDALQRRGLVNQAFAVGPELLGPGAEGDFAEADRASLWPLVDLGMAALDTAPPEYTAAKGLRAPPAPPPVPTAAPSAPAPDDAAPAPTGSTRSSKKDR